MHAHIHVYIHSCIHTYVHTYMQTYSHTYIHTCIHTYMQTYPRIYMLTCIACTSTDSHNNIEQECSVVGFKRRMPHVPGLLESSLASRQLSKNGKFNPSTSLPLCWGRAEGAQESMAQAALQLPLCTLKPKSFFKKKTARAVASQPALAGWNEWTVTASPGLRQRTGYVFSHAKVATATVRAARCSSHACVGQAWGVAGVILYLSYGVFKVAEALLCRNSISGLEMGWSSRWKQLFGFNYAGGFSVTLAFLRYQLYWMDWMQFQPGWPRMWFGRGWIWISPFWAKKELCASSNKSRTALAMFHWCFGIWQVCFQKLSDRLNFLEFSTKKAMPLHRSVALLGFCFSVTWRGFSQNKVCPPYAAAHTQSRCPM